MSNHALLEYRNKLGRIRQLIALEPELSDRYAQARKIISNLSRPSFYEVSNRCNLTCEGCYYFDVDHTNHRRSSAPLDTWKSLFEQDTARGVTRGIFFGAEPALEEEILLLATRYFPFGNISTNGFRKIHPDVQMRIHVSVWGGEKTDGELRGASVFNTALRNYAGDPRAMVVYTVSNLNLHEIREVVHKCADNGLHITFNMYSPTEKYKARVDGSKQNDGRFFRIGQQGRVPYFNPQSLAKAGDIIDGLIDDFPATVLYTKAINRWVTQEEPLFDVSPDTGIAKVCGSLINGTYRFYDSEAKCVEQRRCAHQSVQCIDCRVYGAVFSTRLVPSFHDLADTGNFKVWLDLIDLIDKIFLFKNPNV